MADNSCPLCGGKLEDKECPFCGYRLPDEEQLSAIYDYEPSIFETEPQPIREIYPEVQAEEIYPNREIPNIKVHDNMGYTIPQNNQNNLDKQTENYYTDNSGNANPYAGYTPVGVPNSDNGGNQSPFANKPTGTDPEGVKEYIMANLWKIILSVIFPIVGFVLFFSKLKKQETGQQYVWVYLAAAIAGLILPP